MRILGKILLGLVFTITLATQANAQTDKQKLITSVKIDLNIKDLMKDVTALYVHCTLYKSSNNELKNGIAVRGYAVLYDKGAFPAGINTTDSPTVSFIQVDGFPQSGVEQSISVNVFGEVRAELWTDGECALTLTDRNYSTYTDWIKNVNLAFEQNLTPMDCDVESISPYIMHLCVSPNSKASLSEVVFKRDGKTPTPKKE